MKKRTGKHNIVLDSFDCSNQRQDSCLVVAEQPCFSAGPQAFLEIGGRRHAVSRVGGKIGGILSREYGISLSKIARRVGVCTSAIAKAI
jgi:hypothetical protein